MVKFSDFYHVKSRSYVRSNILVKPDIVAHTEKKGVVRNLLRVPRIVTNSEPFLDFVPIRFRTNKVSYKTVFLQSRKGCCKHGFVKYDPTLCSNVSLNSVP
jgi:hypothetical protein